VPAAYFSSSEIADRRFFFIIALITDIALLLRYYLHPSLIIYGNRLINKGANRSVQKPTSFAGPVEILTKYIADKSESGNTMGMEQFLITS
jgi:hypothetical protein